MAEKLSELKDALSSLGISTNTPGLKGKERLEELRNRLEDALCSEEPAEPSRGGGGRGDELRSIARVVENLTSAQIRENLNLLGQVRCWHMCHGIVPRVLNVHARAVRTRIPLGSPGISGVRS